MRLNSVVSKHRGGDENAYAYKKRGANGTGSEDRSERRVPSATAESERCESGAAETSRWVATLVISIGHREQHHGVNRGY